MFRRFVVWAHSLKNSNHNSRRIWGIVLLVMVRLRSLNSNYILDIISILEMKRIRVYRTAFGNYEVTSLNTNNVRPTLSSAMFKATQEKTEAS